MEKIATSVAEEAIERTHPANFDPLGREEFSQSVGAGAAIFETVLRGSINGLFNRMV